MMKLRNILFAGLLLLGAAACSDNDKPIFPKTPTYDMSGFAKGADVSWLTEMEKAGTKFYTSAGRETECITLLRELGMNSIRLRVWVNPTNGWCNKSDVLVKAWRAHQLGMRLMIDFHYSDSWADPGQQTKPAAWNTYSLDELQNAVAEHTSDVLTALKEKGITPEWVEVGNETGNGMLWNEGKASEHMAQYAALTTAGYNAVKSVFNETKVIVHLQAGDDNSLYRWLFDGLKANGGKWDVIGMSLYPKADTWQSMTDNCIANMRDMIDRYGSEVMLCEVGMPWDEAEECYQFLSSLITKSKEITQCLGVFYWEPQAYGNWNAYTLGAFDNNGQPTIALEAFKSSSSF